MRCPLPTCNKQPNVHVQLAAAQELREQSIVDAKGQNELDGPLAYIARKRRNILRSRLLLWNNPCLYHPSNYRLGLSRLPDVYCSARSIGPSQCTIVGEGNLLGTFLPTSILLAYFL